MSRGGLGVQRQVEQARARDGRGGGGQGRVPLQRHRADAHAVFFGHGLGGADEVEVHRRARKQIHHVHQPDARRIRRAQQQRALVVGQVGGFRIGGGQAHGIAGAVLRARAHLRARGGHRGHLARAADHRQRVQGRVPRVAADVHQHRLLLPEQADVARVGVAGVRAAGHHGAHLKAAHQHQPGVGQKALSERAHAAVGLVQQRRTVAVQQSGQRVVGGPGAAHAQQPGRQVAQRAVSGQPTEAEQALRVQLRGHVVLAGVHEPARVDVGEQRVVGQAGHLLVLGQIYAALGGAVQHLGGVHQQDRRVRGALQPAGQRAVAGQAVQRVVDGAAQPPDGRPARRFARLAQQHRAEQQAGALHGRHRRCVLRGQRQRQAAAQLGLDAPGQRGAELRQRLPQRVQHGGQRAGRLRKRVVDLAGIEPERIPGGGVAPGGHAQERVDGGRGLSRAVRIRRAGQQRRQPPHVRPAQRLHGRAVSGHGLRQRDGAQLLRPQSRMPLAGAGVGRGHGRDSPCGQQAGADGIQGFGEHAGASPSGFGSSGDGLDRVRSGLGFTGARPAAVASVGGAVAAGWFRRSFGRAAGCQEGPPDNWLAAGRLAARCLAGHRTIGWPPDDWLAAGRLAGPPDVRKGRRTIGWPPDAWLATGCLTGLPDAWLAAGRLTGLPDAWLATGRLAGPPDAWLATGCLAGPPDDWLAIGCLAGPPDDWLVVGRLARLPDDWPVGWGSAALGGQSASQRAPSRSDSFSIFAASFSARSPDSGVGW